MTLEDIKDFHNHPISEEEFKELENSEFVEDVEKMGDTPYFPELTWYVLYLVDRTEVHVFL